MSHYGHKRLSLHQYVNYLERLNSIPFSLNFAWFSHSHIRSIEQATSDFDVPCIPNAAISSIMRSVEMSTVS